MREPLPICSKRALQYSLGSLSTKKSFPLPPPLPPVWLRFGHHLWPAVSEHTSCCMVAFKYGDLSSPRSFCYHHHCCYPCCCRLGPSMSCPSCCYGRTSPLQIESLLAAFLWLGSWNNNFEPAIAERPRRATRSASASFIVAGGCEVKQCRLVSSNDPKRLPNEQIRFSLIPVLHSARLGASQKIN